MERKKLAKDRAGPLQTHSMKDWSKDVSTQSLDSDDYGSDDDLYYSKRLDPAEDELNEDDSDTVDKMSSAEYSGEDELRSPPSSKRRRCSSARAAKPTPPWNTGKDVDTDPPEQRFYPLRTPGVQMSFTDTHTPLDLFKLFFSERAVKTVCDNTNKQAASNVAKGSTYKWVDVGVHEFFNYIGLIFYMATIKLDEIKDFWLQDDIFSIPFPATVMTWDRYSSITWNVKMSDPHKDQENNKRKGTPGYDSLFQAKPLLDTIRNACKAFYHPHRNLVMHDGVTTTKSFKFFILADASNGYAVDFAVYTRKSDFLTGEGLSYDSVMSLMNRSYLGSGYHLYTDSFYTSPKLFRDLLGQNFGACGLYREHRKNCPRSTSNALDKSSSKAAIRWIRDGPLVFVKWMDRKEVSICSTIHPAYSGEKVQGWVKPKTGGSMPKLYPCPSSVVDYNRYSSGVEVPYQLIQYYSTQHNEMRWYTKLFLYFLDIAAMNAYTLHKEMMAQRQKTTLTHKAFMEELTAQLCGVSSKVSLKREGCEHVPVPVAAPRPDASKRAASAHMACLMCKIDNRKQSTPWKCKVCDVALCLKMDRNCFEKWHK
ncbi:piggyBac transposable element-derived protein 4-like [Sardina pilchardus]|uniref:piggyBac transposable element-derived protein 4-like n=1 Tax=Sardina pilchardus TaxID=27697 RepID=UPI002E1536EC